MNLFDLRSSFLEVPKDQQDGQTLFPSLAYAACKGKADTRTPTLQCCVEVEGMFRRVLQSMKALTEKVFVRSKSESSIMSIVGLEVRHDAAHGGTRVTYRKSSHSNINFSLKQRLTAEGRI